MYRLATKKGIFIFLEIEDLMLYVVNNSRKLFSDGAFIKISGMEDNMV